MKHLKRYHFPLAVVFVLLALFACSSNEEIELVDSESILPKAEREYIYDEDTTKVEVDSLSKLEKVILNKFPNAEFEFSNDFTRRKSLHMPDRLGYQEKNDILFKVESVSYQFMKWTFSDSLKTINAFYNWLDCFGENCKSIRVAEKVNGSKEAFIIWVSNGSINYLVSDHNLKRKEWEKLLFDDKNMEWNFKMHQATRGEILWLVPKDSIS